MKKYLDSNEPNDKEFIFNTIQDIWEYLLKGGAVTNLDNSCTTTYVLLKDGKPVFNESKEEFEGFRDPQNWRPVSSIMFMKEKFILEAQIESLKAKLASKNYPSIG